MIYNSLVQSKLLYGLLLWGTDLNDVIKVQKKSIRIVTSSAFFSHTKPSFKILGVLKIEDLYLTSLLKFCYKLYNHDVPIYFLSYLDTIHHTGNSCHQYSLRNTIIRKPKHFHSFATNNLL